MSDALFVFVGFEAKETVPFKIHDLIVSGKEIADTAHYKEK
jgi:hypothetical protein